MFANDRTNALPSLVAALSWGAMFPIASSALHRVDPFHLTAVRYGVAALVFLALLAAVEGRRALRPDRRALELLALGSVGFAGFNLLSYIGLEHTRAQDAALIVAAQPLLAVFAVWAMTRRAPSPTTFAAIALALAGVVLVITRGRPSALLHGDGRGGDLLVFLGTVCWLVYTLGARRFPGFSALRYTALSAAGGTITIFAVTEAVTLTGGASAPSGADLAAVWWQLAYIVAFGAVIAVIAWNEGIRRLGPANGALFINLVPVVTFGIGVAGGYRPDGAELAGAGLTIAALIGANLSNRQAIRRPSMRAWAATRSANPAKSRA